ELREHRLGLDDADKLVVGIGDGNGQTGAGVTIEVGQLGVGIGGREVGNQDFGEQRFRRAAVAVGGDQLLVGDDAGNLLAVEYVEGVAVEVLHRPDGVLRSVGAELERRGFVGNV